MTDPDKAPAPTVDAIIIGRNEGARLVACLKSFGPEVRHLIYVDSGSTDGSPVAAADLGAKIVSLDMTKPFTAARARNAGVAAIDGTPPDFIQFVDGDCTLDGSWLQSALAAFDRLPKAAVVCGRRRERFPQASIYNRLADDEWNTPVGLTKACGGDALIRFDAFQAVGGFRADLIAGEEPEMCVRLRQAGWEIHRIDAEMTLHDAAITHLSQWWKRMVRSGHAFAEGASLHGAPPEGHWMRETWRALTWGAGLPLLVALGWLVSGWSLLLLAAYPLQVARLSRLKGWSWAFFTVLGRFPEAQGALRFYRNRLRGKKERLIEYK